jgi:L-lactate dehydrogenase complex protein LldG
MNAPVQSRQRILDRIRTAAQAVAAPTGHLDEAYVAIARTYVRKGKLTRENCLKLLIERLREYDAEVVEAEPDDLPDAIEDQLAASGKRIFVAPAGLPKQWLAPGFDWKIDHQLSSAEIELTEGVVTTASCAIADSGTIALHHTPAEGRRVISLLPDWHLCILLASQVVETLPEYFERFPKAPALITWISGPSATADIEMTRIKGVHGPRFLHVIIVRDEGTPPTQRTLTSAVSAR